MTNDNSPQGSKRWVSVQKPRIESAQESRADPMIVHLNGLDWRISRENGQTVLALETSAELAESVQKILGRLSVQAGRDAVEANMSKVTIPQVELDRLALLGLKAAKPLVQGGDIVRI